MKELLFSDFLDGQVVGGRISRIARIPFKVGVGVWVGVKLNSGLVKEGIGAGILFIKFPQMKEIGCLQSVSEVVAGFCPRRLQIAAPSVPGCFDKKSVGCVVEEGGRPVLSESEEETRIRWRHLHHNSANKDYSQKRSLVVPDIKNQDFVVTISVVFTLGQNVEIIAGRRGGERAVGGSRGVKFRVAPPSFHKFGLCNFKLVDFVFENKSFALVLVNA